VLSAEALALVVAGLVAGATGSWSPCGFSMIETLGRRGRATPPACAAFALGAPLGGILTFGGLAALGALLHGGRAALGVAAAIAIAGAALDAGNVRIVPQIRRQVPEPWRRMLPLPVAAGLYGVLLGMGFTTFVLSFAVPALAAVSIALGDAGLGIALGVAFGLGRALPIVALAPLCEREAGLRAMTAMAERPGLLRAARASGAAALALCAVAFAGGAAQAATPTVAAGAATDPTVAADGTLAWQVPGGPGRLSRGGALEDLPGTHPAFGGPWLALIDRDQIVLSNQADGSTRSVSAPGADAVAVGERWLAWRASEPERLVTLDLADPAAVPRAVARVPSPATVSRPSLDGDVLAYAVAGRTGSAIRTLNLATGVTAALRDADRGVLLTQPALSAGRLLYVRTTRAHQQLLLGAAVRRRSESDHELLRIRSTTQRDAGHDNGHTTQGRLLEDRHVRPLRAARYSLWSTAMTAATAYVTRLRRDGRTADIVRLQL
jgi:hypothetical protein